MTLTQNQKAHGNFSITVYLDQNGRGFVLGGYAKTVPQEYVDKYNAGSLIMRSTLEFLRVIDRTNATKLKNSAPAYARITEAGSLIIE